MAGQEIKALRNNLDEMKKAVEESEEELLKGIDALSRNLPTRSFHMFFDVRDIKQYATAFLKREDIKLKDDMMDLEKRMSHLQSRMEDVERFEIDPYSSSVVNVNGRQLKTCANWKRNT